MPKIRIGFIGFGGHARHHAENLGEAFDLAAIWDPGLQASDLGSWAGKSVASLEELLADTNLPTVFIGSPDKFHLDQIEMALLAGKHVLCEKPLGVGEGKDAYGVLARLEELFALARENNCVLTSCHPRRTDKAYRWLRKQVFGDDAPMVSELGPIISFETDFSYHISSDPNKHGGSLMDDHLSHEVDLMTSLLGIKGFQAWKLHDGADRYEVAGLRQDGVSFRFQGTRRLRKEKYPEWCRVRFTEGHVELDLLAEQVRMSYHTLSSQDEPVWVVNEDADLAHAWENRYEDRLRGVMGQFALQIMGGDPYLSNAEMLQNTMAGVLLKNPGVQSVLADYTS